jgi:hypothetical protein
MFSVCICAFFCVCVQVKALRRADHPPKESYRMSIYSEKKTRSENGEFHGGRPRPTGAVVPMKKNRTNFVGTTLKNSVQRVKVKKTPFWYC